jgi:hypothetical protein
MADMERAAARFASDTDNHKMTVLHDDGLYRHVRFVNPERSWAYWFDLITVPGALIFQGDGNSYVFHRLEDMFEFFRVSADCGAPNVGYWAEKLVGGEQNAQVYQQEILQRHMDDAVAEALKENARLTKLPDAVRDRITDEMVSDESYDRRLVEDFKYWINPDDEFAVPHKHEDFRFEQYEWRCRDYHWWFLWACHAIVWGIAQYDGRDRDYAAATGGGTEGTA